MHLVWTKLVSILVPYVLEWRLCPSLQLFDVTYIWPFWCCLWRARFSSKRHESDQLSAALDEIPRFLTSKRSGGLINTVRLSYPFCRLPFCLADNQNIAITYHVAFCRKSQWRFLLLWSEEWLIETLSVNYVDHVTRAHAVAARTDITAGSSSTDDDQQNDPRLTLKLTFCSSWNVTSP